MRPSRLGFRRLAFSFDEVVQFAEMEVPESFFAAMASIGLQGREVSECSIPPAARIAFDPLHNRYEFSGYGFIQPFCGQGTLDALTTLTAGLVGGFARSQTERLCFHAGAVAINGRAWMIPSAYFAGKSSLCVSLAKIGGDVISDDALILEPRGRTIRSFGFPTRIRRDFERCASVALRTYIADHSLLSDDRLVFLDIGSRLEATKPRDYQLKGILFLSRDGTSPPSLSALPAEKSLSKIIWQNFARVMTPDQILMQLAEIVHTLPNLVLNYSDAEEAAEFLSKQLADPAKVIDPSRKTPPDLTIGTKDDQFEIWQGDGLVFVADRRYGRILQLNKSAYVMWQVAQRATDRADALVLLSSLYEAIGREQLASDFESTISLLVESALLQPETAAKLSGAQ